MDEFMLRILKDVKKTLPGAFITMNGELILDKKWNVYFRLEDVKNLNDLKYKVLAFVSRSASKGQTPQLRKKMKKFFNDILEHEFTDEQIRDIYTYLGNGIKESLTRIFIESDYDFNIISEYVKDREKNRGE